MKKKNKNKNRISSFPYLKKSLTPSTNKILNGGGKNPTKTY